MFATEHVPLILRSLKLSLGTDDDEGVTLRYCATTFRMPRLSFERADSIVGMPVATHCFGPDRLPSWTVDLVRFAPPEAQYTLEVKSAPDAPPLVTLPLVAIATCKVWRPKPTHRDLALEFVTKHEIAPDAKDLRDILTLWIAGAVYATFTAVQLSLDLSAPSSARTEH